MLYNAGVGSGWPSRWNVLRARALLQPQLKWKFAGRPAGVAGRRAGGQAGSWYGAESKVACRRGSGTRNTHITRNLLKRLLFSIRFLPSTSYTSSYSALHCSHLFGKPQIPMSVGQSLPLRRLLVILVSSVNKGHDCLPDVLSSSLWT